MEIHYFQRYQQRENVHTNNALLLISRLYSYSHTKFFNFLKTNIFDDNFQPEIIIKSQEKNENCVPDAIISQDSFKIIIETKLGNKFDIEQLKRHLNSFKNETRKVLITLSPFKIDDKTQTFINEFKQETVFEHKHLTFEKLIKGIMKELNEIHDYDFIEILTDYENYCYEQDLITGKRMRAVLATTTLEINKKLNLYYDPKRGFSDHDYIGLYADKAIKAIGKRTNTFVAEFINGKLNITKEGGGSSTNDEKQQIEAAIKDSKKYGYDLDTKQHRYFFVDKFYETDFKKNSPNAMWGTRFFNLEELLGTNKLPDTEEIAQKLKEKTWE